MLDMNLHQEAIIRTADRKIESVGSRAIRVCEKGYAMMKQKKLIHFTLRLLLVLSFCFVALLGVYDFVAV